MTAPHTTATTDPQSIIAALQAERDTALAQQAALAEELAARDAALAQRNSEFGERIEHQAATIDVLKAMSASPGDAQPVFDLIVRRAQELCNGSVAALLEYDGQLVRYRSEYGAPQHIAPDVLQAYKNQYPMAPTPTINSHRALLQKRIIHVRDMGAEPEANEAARVMGLGLGSEVHVPLLRGGKSVGVMPLISMKMGGFSDTQIALLKTFAEQAVIAITSAETYRALQTRTSDLQETLEQQTATSDVLKVISRSTFNLQPVLDTVAETAAKLCDAEQAAIYQREGGLARLVANCGFPPEYEALVRGQETFPLDFYPQAVVPRAIREGHTVHIHDVAVLPGYGETAIRLGKQRTSLGVPLLREGEAIGAIVLARQRVEPFTDRQIELVSTFADQAVIAIENTRLLTEQREALEQQTATAEVLQVINSSPGNLAPVFDTMLEKAVRLCQSAFGALFTYDGEFAHLVAAYGMTPDMMNLFREPVRPAKGAPSGRIADGEPYIHVLDTSDQDIYRAGDRTTVKFVDQIGARTALFVGLRQEAALLGYLVIFRREVHAFSNREIELVMNFAAQAVIAMENARLLTEQREALEQQTATAEVLQVINASPGDLNPVFEAILDRALRVCEAAFGFITSYDGEHFHTIAGRNLPPAFAEILRTPYRPPQGAPAQRLIDGASFVQIADVLEEEGTLQDLTPVRRALVETARGRTFLTVPCARRVCFLATS